MKIKELLESNYHDDFDDEQEEVPSDPDADKVPHILMQLKKAADLGGNYPISFQNGEKAKLSMNDIAKIVKLYANAKPMERQRMQAQAIQSPDGLKALLL